MATIGEQGRFFLGFSPVITQQLAAWHSRWSSIVGLALPSLPPPRQFKPKVGLPVLECYRSSAPSSFWGVFPQNLVSPGKSLVDPDKLESLARESKFPRQDVLAAVLLDLRHGAVIGCKEPFRAPSRALNASSAYENGEKVTDAIAAWCKKGFCYGPVDPSLAPAEAKFSGLMTRDKPDGSVRIIINLSAPEGFSVNDGISSDEFPTTMSSTRKWLEVLHLTGVGSSFCKVDWSDAYKHVSVCSADLPLQWFEWLGMCFAELCLVFGASSSAGIYDRLAKIVLHCVLHRACFPKAWVVQHLDDVCAAAPAGSNALQLFDEEYAAVASLLGVRLAPRDDPSKSFGPSTSGVVLGVHYDTAAWTWALPDEKLSRLLHSLRAMVDAPTVVLDQLWSVVGKILHVHALIPDGRFHLFHLLKANASSSEPKFSLTPSAQLRGQLWFWYSILRTCSSVASIPCPHVTVPPWALNVYTDAAGGSWSTPGLGCGAVSTSWWLYIPWSRAINAGRPSVDGRKLDRCLSMLELVGPLAAICSAPSCFRNSAAQFWVDNAGSVFIWQKGYSMSCTLSTTVVTALATVAAGLGCKVEIRKILRCSTALAGMADALSKADFRRFRSLASSEGLGLPLEPLRVPVALRAWLEDPVPDWGLGERLLQEIERRGEAVLSL